VTRDGGLLVNELAPRPHNSYHAASEPASPASIEKRGGCDRVCHDFSPLRRRGCPVVPGGPIRRILQAIYDL